MPRPWSTTAAYSTARSQNLKRKLVTLWMINSQRDSLELLNEYMTAMPNADVHVVRNGHFGKENEFVLYNKSSTRASVEERGGKSVTFPSWPAG